MAGGSGPATGIGLVFADQAWTGKVLSLEWNGIEAEEQDVTNHSSAEPDASAGEYGGMEFEADPLQDLGTWDVEFLLDESKMPLVGQPAEEITLTYRKKAADAAAATAAVNGWVKSVGQGLPHRGQKTGRMTIRLTGVGTINPATA